jgi:hypothetical protein
MRNELCFSTFDPLFSDAPCLCDICETKPSVFQFESGSTESGSRESDAASRPVQGYCCAPCAVELLNKLQDTESLAWAEEEVSVQKDGMDVSEFNTRRLATFGRHGHN